MNLFFYHMISVECNKTPQVAIALVSIFEVLVNACDV